MIDMVRIEVILDQTKLADAICGIEAAMPKGVRRRQLSVRTLLLGMCLAAADRRPAYLSEVHVALCELCEDDQRRLGVIALWTQGEHLVTYRQVERTFSVMVAACVRSDDIFTELCDQLLEASIPEKRKDTSSSYAADWSDLESHFLPQQGERVSVDPDASWGHRNAHTAGVNELFFGHFFQLVTMVRDEDGGPVPELVRRVVVTSPKDDPVPLLVPVFERMVTITAIAIRDVLVDSGYAHRVAEHWALPMRRLGATLVMDLHPHDRGRQGTFQGSQLFNGNCYCPATPEGLFSITPLGRSASSEQVEAHDERTVELARYKLGVYQKPDDDGYSRVGCPAQMGKVRCPLCPPSMTLSYALPEIAHPPEHPPRCCTQNTITVPPSVNAKTAQKHDYPSKAHRSSYARRTGAERANATVKDRASIDVSKGWCRIPGLAPTSLFLATSLVVRNLRVLDAFETTQADNERRIAQGLEPRTRKRRRIPIDALVDKVAS